MADTRKSFVHEAELRLEPDADPGAVGAAVTTALCGHWEHEGPCRWPHNNAIEPPGTFRTIFVAPPSEEPEVRKRIEDGLRQEFGWVVLETRPREVAADEQSLAERLASA